MREEIGRKITFDLYEAGIGISLVDCAIITGMLIQQQYDCNETPQPMVQIDEFGNITIELAIA